MQLQWSTVMKVAEDQSPAAMRFEGDMAEMIRTIERPRPPVQVEPPARKADPYGFD